MLLAAQGMQSKDIAAQLGIGAASVSRHWRRHGRELLLVRGVKVSRDPQFAHKLEDIVGLQLRPPEHATVLCVDEKSQLQALDRTQPRAAAE